MSKKKERKKQTNQANMHLVHNNGSNHNLNDHRCLHPSKLNENSDIIFFLQPHKRNDRCG